MAYEFYRELGFAENQEARELIEQSRICPDCGEMGNITTSWRDVTELGVTYRAPVRKCSCGFEYTDYEYEERQEKALFSAGKLRRR